MSDDSGSTARGREALRAFDVWLATAIDLDSAILAQRVEFWEGRGSPDESGVVWVEKSLPEWCKAFPFWSERTIRRALKRLEEAGVLQVQWDGNNQHCRRYRVDPAEKARRREAARRDWQNAQRLLGGQNDHPQPSVTPDPLWVDKMTTLGGQNDHPEALLGGQNDHPQPSEHIESHAEVSTKSTWGSKQYHDGGTESCTQANGSPSTGEEEALIRRFQCEMERLCPACKGTSSRTGKAIASLRRDGARPEDLEPVVAFFRDRNRGKLGDPDPSPLQIAEYYPGWRAVSSATDSERSDRRKRERAVTAALKGGPGS